MCYRVPNWLHAASRRCSTPAASASFSLSSERPLFCGQINAMLQFITAYLLLLLYYIFYKLGHKVQRKTNSRKISCNTSLDVNYLQHKKSKPMHKHVTCFLPIFSQNSFLISRN